MNVCHYHYAHYQKDEIERQVKDLLDNGVIKHSNSAFSSPIILVHKKDQSWRMCVDYRALNKATILDKFPIPMIEELFDELHGAKFFTKLDLKLGTIKCGCEKRISTRPLFGPMKDIMSIL